MKDVQDCEVLYAVFFKDGRVSKRVYKLEKEGDMFLNHKHKIFLDLSRTPNAKLGLNRKSREYWYFLTEDEETANAYRSGAQIFKEYIARYLFGQTRDISPA